MKLLAENGDALEIQISRADLENILIILKQPKHLDTEYHQILPESVEWLKKMVEQTLTEDGDVQIVAMSKTQLVDMSQLIYADKASAVEELEGVSLNERSSKLEKEIVEVERALGIKVSKYQ